jgi:hypothetical protein
VPGKLLDIAKIATGFRSPPGCPGDERSSPSVAARPSEPHVTVEPAEPHRDSSRAVALPALAVDDGALSCGVVAPRCLEGNQRFP